MGVIGILYCIRMSFVEIYELYHAANRSNKCGGQDRNDESMDGMSARNVKKHLHEIRTSVT